MRFQSVRKQCFTQQFFSRDKVGLPSPSLHTEDSRKTGAGFTLVEMLVVISIFVIITLVVLAKNAQFNNTILHGTLAYDVALSIREAQAYGLGVREAGVGSPEEFDIPHGIELWSAASSQDPTTYYLGADLDTDGHIESNERIKTFKFNRGFQIAEICGSTDEQICEVTTQKLSIVFNRPEPDAVMTRGGGPPVWVYTEIHIEAPDGSRRVVAVTDAGQISVLAP